MYELLRKEVVKENNEMKEKRISWLQEHENILKNSSTATRWEQYQSGTITRKQAVIYATKRIEKEFTKRLETQLTKLDNVSKADSLQYIYINTYYTKSGACHAETMTNNDRFKGSAGGWGYDKESSAVADCFNNDLSVLKVLYDLKEKGLADGLTDKTATGRDNRYIIGYGAGYSALPYYEGGVGIDCFKAILKKAGFETSTTWGKRENSYRVHKAN